jgi:CRP-like cAMP-binding protein
MSEGSYFGEIGVLITHKRSCSIKASTYTSLLTVDKDDFLSILEKYPLIMKYLKAVAKQRLETSHPHDISDEQDHGFIDAYRSYKAKH